MLRLLGSRLLQLVGVLLAVTFISWWLLSLLPGDPCFLSVGTGATEDQLEQCRSDLNLDEDIVTQYRTWLGNSLQGDLGRSYLNNITVTQSLGQKLPVTLWLLVYSQLIALVIAVPLGLLAGYKQGGWIDRIVSGAAFAMLATPSFVLGVFLLVLFAVRLDWYDIGSYVGPTENLLEHWKVMVLPSVALAAGTLPVYLRLLRTDVIQTLQEDFVGVARAKGMPPAHVLFRHVLRPSSFTLLTVAGIQAGQFINGALIIEFLFELDGVGAFLITSVFAQEFLIVQSLVALIATTFVVFNFVVDLTYSFLDPRVRRR
ncbi:MAG: ABC transporter permease [Acidimicrobiales bacterium]|nr:ABC transporter permease [Acidimicrobiales bacterium]